MTTHKKILAGLTGLLLISTLAAPASAQDRRERERFERHDERYHPYFVGRDLDHWRGGNWYHGPHEGRDGWWWVIDGAWYFYPAPIYPYPDPNALPMIVAAPPPPGPPPGAVISPMPPPPQNCRQYNGDAIVNGSNQPFYGQACLGPDGQWHIVGG